jgi:hypothetical protein
MKDRKQIILEILKNSGPLHKGTLIERVQNVTGEGYPVPSCSRHLRELQDDLLIKAELLGNKNLYSLQAHPYDIEGAMILENMGGKIFTSRPLYPFSPRIEKGTKFIFSERYYFFIEFNSKRICLSIEKDALPFCIHVSRKEHDDEEKIFKWLGQRAIIVKLPVGKLSSFKQEEGTGHILIQFNKSKVTISELKATNKPSILIIPNFSFELYLKKFSLVSSSTVKNKKYETSVIPIFKSELQDNEEKEISLPLFLQLSEDCNVAVF